MRTIDAVRRAGVGIGPAQRVDEAATLMDQAGIGALAVVDDGRLVGLVTDRDLVRRVLARGLPPDTRVDTVMTSPVLTVDADGDLHQCFGLFRSQGVRRLAVVRGGEFVGMITVDDLLVDLAGNLADLARPVAAEILSAHRDPAVGANP